MAVNIINRDNVEALIEEQVVKEIIQADVTESAFLQMAKKLPNMSSKTTRLRVLDVMPTAYWVDGDTGVKETTKQEWDNVYLTAAELAVIVPIPEAVLADADTDIMGEVLPRIREAFAKKVDSAVLFGVNKPPEWDLSIIDRARIAGNNVAVTGTPSVDYYDLLLGEGGIISKVEESGNMVTGAIAGTPMRAKLRGIKTTDGYPIFNRDMQGKTDYTLDGSPIIFPLNGAFDNAIAQLIVGDFSKAVYAIRQDVTAKILTEAVIQDPSTGSIVYNLAQQDMIALRVTFRMGWALPNPVTNLNGDRTNVPFAYLEPATPQTTQTVTLTVTDDDSTSPTEIAGAQITIDGGKLVTNASGVAVFKLTAGTYNVKIKANGYKQFNTTLTVASSAVTQTYTLTEA